MEVFIGPAVTIEERAPYLMNERFFLAWQQEKICQALFSPNPTYKLFFSEPHIDSYLFFFLSLSLFFYSFIHSCS